MALGLREPEATDVAAYRAVRLEALAAEPAAFGPERRALRLGKQYVDEILMQRFLP